MKNNPRHAKPAFTLIELMAVITIIVILAGLVIGGMGYVTEKQAKSKATVQIALLSKALEEYKLDMGTYPPTGNSTNGSGQSASSLYIPLFYEGYDYAVKGSPATWVKTVGSNADFPKAAKIYLGDLNPVTSKQGWVTTVSTVPASTTVIDPWSKEYSYRTATDAAGAANKDTQNPDFDLWSWGKDGKTNADPKHKDCRDDIRNF